MDAIRHGLIGGGGYPISREVTASYRSSGTNGSDSKKP
jgi:hypothetical protein